VTAYDALLDRLEEIRKRLALSKEPTVKTVRVALIKMEEKLGEYYGRTEKPAAYVDSLILTPQIKLNSFNRTSFGRKYKNKYRDECHVRFLEKYATKPTPTDSPVVPAAVPSGPRKRKANSMLAYLDKLMTGPIEGEAEFHDEYLEYISQPPVRDTDDALK
jgi:hypothetical protein